MLKTLRYGMISIVVLAIALAVGFLSLRFACHNPTTGTLTLPGLHGKVTITRTSQGIPIIRAYDDDLDAFFALGFVHGQDRFWQMAFQRLVLQGRLSEVFGQKTVAKDRLMRIYGLYEAAKLAYRHYDAHSRAVVRAYTAGVNAYLHTGRLPLEIKMLRFQPKPWTEVDSIAWQKMMAFDLQHGVDRKIKRQQVVDTLGEQALTTVLPPYPVQAPTVLSSVDLAQSRLASVHLPAIQEPLSHQLKRKVLQQLEQFKNISDRLREQLGMQDLPGLGSNAWVVDGTLTQSGKPLLANDPHLRLQTPNMWYLVALNGPHLHVQGASLPGLPGVVLGHNNNIAWGMTNVDPNTEELYIEPPNRSVRSHKEVIQVKDGQPVTIMVARNDKGPIISDLLPHQHSKQQAIALQWTALQADDTSVAGLIALNYAQNWSQFCSALRLFVAPAQNFFYADAQGHIGYYLAGKIPLRYGWQSDRPVVDDAKHQWAGFIPFEQLPHVYNPPEHVLISGNNKPVPANYPYPVSFRYRQPPYRALRIKTLLAQMNKLNMVKFESIQADQYSNLWHDLRPYLLKTHALNQLSEHALKQLKAWDGIMHAKAIAPTILAYWFRQLTAMPLDDLPFAKTWREPLFIVKQLKSNGVFCQTEDSHNCSELLSVSLAAAMREAHHDLGINLQQWQWGRVHPARFIDVGIGRSPWFAWLLNRSQPSGGGYYTVNVGTYNSSTYTQLKGAGLRAIYDLNDLAHSEFMITPGESGNPFSRHFADLLTGWQRGVYLSLYHPNTVQSGDEVLTLVAEH